MAGVGKLLVCRWLIPDNPSLGFGSCLQPLTCHSPQSQNAFLPHPGPTHPLGPGLASLLNPAMAFSGRCSATTREDCGQGTSF